VLYRHDGGVLGLPEQVAALCLPEQDERRAVLLCNVGKETVKLDVCAEGTDLKVTSATVDGRSPAAIEENRVTVELCPARERRVEVVLG
jgi:hypothetical protein